VLLGLWTLGCGLWTVSAQSVATLSTDLSDYVPGQYITFTGTGWQPGETVTIEVYETTVDPFFDEGGVSAVADGSGTISNGTFLVQQSFLGQGFLAQATGLSSGLTASVAFEDAPGPGTAPVSPPSGGFGIDGDLQANTPTVGIGDWLPGPSGAGGNVLTAAGGAIDPVHTYHLTDAYNTNTDNNFAGGQKFDGNPNSWTWVSNPVGAKDDLNNGLIHFTTGTNDGHTWVMVAADRLSKNGDAYIDFEFLQTNMTVTGGPTSGGFLSYGTNGGRTAGDFVLTLELTKGGTAANFFVQRWEAVPVSSQAPAGYDYVDRTTNTPAGSVYAAVNTVVVPVSYPAFAPTGNGAGAGNYDVNTFVEAAVDLTALLGAFNPCETFGVETILIKTKESQSPTATITDFIAPQQIVPPIVFGPSVSAGKDQTVCSLPGATSTTFTMAGTATPGTSPITSTNWQVISYSGNVAPTITTPGLLTTTVKLNSAAPATATLRLTVTDNSTCGNHVRSDDVVLTVNPLPDCSITGANDVFVGSKGNPYSVASGAGLTYSWSFVSPVVTGVTFNGSTTGSSVKVDVASGVDPIQNPSFTLQVVVSNSTTHCSQTCTKMVSLATTIAGCDITVGPTTVCAGATHIGYTVSPGGTVQSYAWDLTSAPNTSGAVFNPSPQPSDSTVYVDAGVVGGYRVHVVVTFTDGSSLDCFTDTTVQQVTASSGATPISCNGGMSTVTVTASGGTGSYTGTGTFLEPAGSYTFTVSDTGNGCTATTTVSISQPPLLTASSSAPAIACHGGSAVVTVSASGGTGSISGTGTFLEPAGSFTFTVTDAKGCTANTTISLSDPPLLTASSSAPAIACHGGSAVVTVSASGGTGSISGTGTFLEPAGSYTFTVTDAKGCTANTTISLSDPPLLTASSSAPAIACHGGSAVVTVSASGGTGSISGTGTFTRTAGSYTFTVTDAKGCTANSTISLSDPLLLTASSSAPAIACQGGSAVVTVSASGGTGSISGTGTFLEAAGSYTFTVTDANGCIANTTISLSDPPLLTASSSAPTIACHGGSAVVTVSASGGTGAISGTGTFLEPAGSYTFTVTDAKGCTANTTISLSDPPLLTASSSAPAIACHGGSAVVTVCANGGTGSISGTGTFTRTAGSYTFTVTDAKGCTANTTISLSDPLLLTASSSAPAIACHGGSAVVTVSASGGTGSISGTGTFLEPAGSYTFTVTDAKGCTANTTISLSNPPLLTASSSAPAIACQGGSAVVTVSASGGTGAISGTGTFLEPAGSYTFTVTDAKGCTANATISLSDPPVLTASSSAPAIACHGGSAVVTVSANGGTGTIKGTGTFSKPAGSYTFTVTDAAGCTANTTISLTDPDVLACSVSGPEEVVAGRSGNTLTAKVNGGTGSYKYWWTNDNSGWIIVDKTADPVVFSSTSGVSTVTFGVVVTDANGCTTHCTETVMGSQPALVTDTMRCTFPNNCSLSGVNSSFRLIFTQDPQNPSCYKLNASNPGQFYYNVFFDGTPGAVSNVTVTLPYPFVTQGANPIELYDGSTTSTSGGQTCIVPGNKTFAGSTQVTLANYNYGTNPVVGSTVYTFTLPLVIPPSGSAYLAIHMDYGLKKQTFSQDFTPATDGSGNGLICGSTTYAASSIVVTNGVKYNFGASGPVTGSATVASCNDFKKTPGTAGLVANSLSLNPVPGSTAVLKDSKNTVLGSATTDSDGWYMINYKWTGKAATFYLTMTPPTGFGSPKTQTITLKANGFIEADFTAP
jgi:hypothetical protein